MQRVARKQSQNLGNLMYTAPSIELLIEYSIFCRIRERQQGATCATPSAKSLTTYGGS